MSSITCISLALSEIYMLRLYCFFLENIAGTSLKYVHTIIIPHFKEKSNSFLVITGVKMQRIGR